MNFTKNVAARMPIAQRARRMTIGVPHQNKPNSLGKARTLASNFSLFLMKSRIHDIIQNVSQWLVPYQYRMIIDMKYTALISLFLIFLSAAFWGCTPQNAEINTAANTAVEPNAGSQPNGESNAGSQPVEQTQEGNETSGNETQTAANMQLAQPAADSGRAPNEAIYFIMIDRFFNSHDNSDIDLFDPAGWHGGDLEGIRQKLPWLKALGITKIWLSPVFTSAHEKFFGNGAFHGYWTYDINKLDPNFGTEEDFIKLAKEAKENDIEIILDFVVNHVGYGSTLVESKPEWFHPALTIEDWNDPDQLVNRQVHGLPDLDQSNTEVYAYITNAAWKWLTMPNIAGFRLDAVKHVGLDFWSRFNQELKSGKRDIMLIGEYFDGNPAKVNEVQKTGKFTQMFDFPLSFALRDVFCEHKSLAGLASIITNDRQYTSANDMVTFIDNHDMPRFISLCHNDIDAMSNALRVMLAWRGIPSIFYGTEVPLAGDKEPENRADMNFDRADLFPVIQSALRLRALHPVFAKGVTATYKYKPGFVVFAREFQNEQALIAINLTSERQLLELPAGKWHDAEIGRPIRTPASIRANSVKLLINESVEQSIIDTSTKPITFRVPNDGHTYAIAGSAPELGQWNPADAPKTTSEITIDLPAQTVVTYKPVRVADDGSVTWADGDNRELFTSKDTAVDVTW